MEKWSSSHYDSKIKLTKADIKNGSVRVDAYAVYRANEIHKQDKSGVLFHLLKTILRFGVKNTVEREVLAIVNQSLRLAREEGIDIRESLKKELNILEEIYDGSNK